MTNFTIKILPEADNPWCVQCGERMVAGPGAHLFQQDDPICRDCGKKHAPHLVALIDLAHVAGRVGKVCRHTLVPPMEALLALARAADDFTQSAPRLLKKAG
jgi:hypothetical protein